MLTKQGYKVEARNGPEFEKEFLNSFSEGLAFPKKKDLSPALRECLAGYNKKHPDTYLGGVLYSFVERYLKHQGVKYKRLISCGSISGSADIHHETDFFFYLENGEKEFVVTIDLFFTFTGRVVEVIKDCNKFSHRFDGLGGYFPLEFAIAKDLLTDQGNYSLFQSLIYLFKRNRKQKKEKGRPSNHLIITPFDIERSRGLRAVAREIALSFKNQIQGNSK